MKFDDELEFLKVLNKKVRDGFDILEILSSSHGTVVTIMGTDGCRDCLALFRSKEDFNRSMMEVPSNA